MTPTVLVVDDDPATCRLIQKLLTPLGYAVRTVGDGGAALVAGAGTPPQLAIIDLFLPGVDGLSVMRCLRQDDPQLPVILMSAVSTPLFGPEGGPDASDRERIPFLAKPFGLTTLMALVQQQLPLLNGSHPARQP